MRLRCVCITLLTASSLRRSSPSPCSSTTNDNKRHQHRLQTVGSYDAKGALTQYLCSRSCQKAVDAADTALRGALVKLSVSHSLAHDPTCSFFILHVFVSWPLVVGMFLYFISALRKLTLSGFVLYSRAIRVVFNAGGTRSRAYGHGRPLTGRRSCGG